jgi:hypothetical protein
MDAYFGPFSLNQLYVRRICRTLKFDMPKRNLIWFDRIRKTRKFHRTTYIVARLVRPVVSIAGCSEHTERRRLKV